MYVVEDLGRIEVTPYNIRYILCIRSFNSILSGNLFVEEVRSLQNLVKNVPENSIRCENIVFPLSLLVRKSILYLQNVLCILLCMHCMEKYT